jgi:hypothetical protein
MSDIKEDVLLPKCITQNQKKRVDAKRILKVATGKTKRLCPHWVKRERI